MLKFVFIWQFFSGGRRREGPK